MAKIQFAKVAARMRGATGVNAPDSVTGSSDTKTIAASSAQSDLTLQPGETWSIVASADCFLLFGTNPTAVSDSGWLLAAGVPREFNATLANEKCAFIEST